MRAHSCLHAALHLASFEQPPLLVLDDYSAGGCLGGCTAGIKVRGTHAKLRVHCRLYKQVCLECAAVTRGPDGGLQTKSAGVDGDAPIVEEVRRHRMLSCFCAQHGMCSDTLPDCMLLSVPDLCVPGSCTLQSKPQQLTQGLGMQDTGEAYIAQTFIMEQYLDGPEVDVDLVVSQASPA